MEPNPTDATTDSESAPTADAGDRAKPSAHTSATTATVGQTSSSRWSLSGALNVPLVQAPPMAATAAFSGLLAVLIVRLMLPSRDVEANAVLWEIAARVGTFAVNLSAVAGMVALVLGALPWLRSQNEGPRPGGLVNVRKRLLIATLGGMLIPIWLRAVFFGRESMNGALANLGAATACSLSLVLLASVLRDVRARPLQLLPVALIAIATLCSLLLLTLQALTIVAPFSAIHRMGWLIAELGEGAYLGVMLCALTLLPPRPWTLRQRAELAVGVVITLMVSTAFLLSVVTFGREFAISVYYAQHVTWFLDGAIWMYAIPLAVGLGASITAMLGNDSERRQLATAVLIWIAAGYAPRAPWRFVLLVLSATLVARAIGARTHSVNSATAVTNSTSQTPST